MRRTKPLPHPPLRPPIETSRGLRKALTMDELHLLLQAATRSSLRDHALVATMYDAALRSGEPGLLRISYMERLAEKQLWVFRQKGSESGYVALHPATVEVLSAWIDELYPGTRKPPRRHIFPGYQRRGLSRDRVLRIVKSLCSEAGLPAEVSYAHVLRNSRAQHMFEAAGEDPTVDGYRVLKAVQKLLGHRSLMTTMNYYRSLTGVELELLERVTDEALGG